MYNFLTIGANELKKVDDINFSLHSNELGVFLKYDLFSSFYDSICSTIVLICCCLWNS
jgi:hypothetical protein